MSVFFFNFLAALSLAFLIGLPVFALVRYFLARNWLQVKGTLISVSPLEIDYEKAYFLYVRKCLVEYEYWVNNVRYENNLVIFIDIFGLFFVSGKYYKELHKYLANSFIRDRIINIYVSSEDPEQAVITRDLPWNSVLGYFLAALLIALGWLAAQPMLTYLGRT